MVCPPLCLASSNKGKTHYLERTPLPGISPLLRPRPPHLGVDLRERWPQFVRLPSEDDGFRAGVQGRHLHRHPRGLQDLLQGVALRTYDVLVLGLLHLHGDGRGLPFLHGERGRDQWRKPRRMDGRQEGGRRIDGRERLSRRKRKPGDKRRPRGDTDLKERNIFVFASRKFELNDISILILLFSGEIQFSLGIISGLSITGSHLVRTHTSSQRVTHPSYAVSFTRRCAAENKTPPTEKAAMIKSSSIRLCCR